MGVDELVDDVDTKTKKDKVEGLVKELGIDDKEELEELEDKLNRLQKGLLKYDKKMENIEERIDVLESSVSKLMKVLKNIQDETESKNNKQDDQTNENDEDPFGW